MCCHCHQTIESGLAFKDFLPLIGTIIVVSTGYIGITVQVNKNRRSRWIEDFREAIAKYTSVSIFMFPTNTQETRKEAANVNYLIQMLLDYDNAKHKQLAELLNKLNSKLTKISSPEDVEFLSDSLTEIFALSTEIVKEEKSKLLRFW